MMNALDTTSTRPYLVRALYEWCTDNGFTPYIAVLADDTVQVPREYVQNGEIVLNISFDATSSLQLGNEYIEFKARFAGVARDIMVPLDRVIAIYARENGQGMAFPVSVPAASAGPEGAASEPALVSVPDASQPPAPAAAPASVKLVVDTSSAASTPPASDESSTPAPPNGGKGKRPALKRIK